MAVSNYCPLNYCSSDEINITLIDVDSAQQHFTGADIQCNSGILCGGCQPGLSLALGSDQCLNCSNNFVSLLPFAIGGIILVLFIKY